MQVSYRLFVMQNKARSERNETEATPTFRDLVEEEQASEIETNGLRSWKKTRRW